MFLLKGNVKGFIKKKKIYNKYRLCALVLNRANPILLFLGPLTMLLAPPLLQVFPQQKLLAMRALV